MPNSKLNSTIFEELTPPTLVDTHTPTYPLNTMQVVVRSTIHSITHIIDGICRKYCTIFCNLEHLKHEGNYPKPNWDLSFLKAVLWVEGISNDLNGSCRKTAHIFTNLKHGR
jgi:hypothetical protein